MNESNNDPFLKPNHNFLTTVYEVDNSQLYSTMPTKPETSDKKTDPQLFTKIPQSTLKRSFQSNIFNTPISSIKPNPDQTSKKLIYPSPYISDLKSKQNEHNANDSLNKKNNILPQPTNTTLFNTIIDIIINW